ncbi:adenylyl-sulfate kinase [Clostridium sp. OS1-26]|uniref:adenylyl-sulfate kinase n=1 Tax=Clostridium sp. OS1-26 TaxID=3070681 RepID=UPI0027DF4559|nr:adenylyl-sulfate kinase [Clostridium sp. OS1-26]WML33763.1 adenylyl-sulfate kinase [Clostridium sp. OS1-26]
MKTNKSNNIVWHSLSIEREHREELLNQKGLLIWFTGLSGSGKSTIADALNKELYRRSYLTYMLDGDNLRHRLNADLGFSREDRIENIRRVRELSGLFVDAGIITITTFISPFKEDRQKVRDLVKDRFIEVFIDCDLEICKQRDPKGLYKKAREGKIKDFTGIDSVYEKPENAEITIYSHKQSIDECVKKIIAYLEDNKYLIK